MLVRHLDLGRCRHYQQETFILHVWIAAEEDHIWRVRERLDDVGCARQLALGRDSRRLQVNHDEARAQGVLVLGIYQTDQGFFAGDLRLRRAKDLLVCGLIQLQVQLLLLAVMDDQVSVLGLIVRARNLVVILAPNSAADLLCVKTLTRQEVRVHVVLRLDRQVLLRELIDVDVWHWLDRLREAIVWLLAWKL
jgi:hypothetical protein